MIHLHTQLEKLSDDAEPLNNGLDYFLKLGQIVLNRRVSRPSAVSPQPRGSELGITRSTLPGMGPAAVERAVIFLAKGKGNP